MKSLISLTRPSPTASGGSMETRSFIIWLKIVVYTAKARRRGGGTFVVSIIDYRSMIVSDWVAFDF